MVTTSRHRRIADELGVRERQVEAAVELLDGGATVPLIARYHLAELEKPGRDPRPGFVTATFREGVGRLDDLDAGMVLEGVVTNVAELNRG
jgi:transcriptional accessory protein Tex/SPT6